MYNNNMCSGILILRAFLLAAITIMSQVCFPLLTPSGLVRNYLLIYVNVIASLGLLCGYKNKDSPFLRYDAVYIGIRKSACRMSLLSPSSN
jgi:hypothetical protein